MPWSKGAESGKPVYAVGVDADGGAAVPSGRVVALHDYDGAQVIQVSALFGYGSSGGGLFDEQGRTSHEPQSPPRMRRRTAPR